VQTQEKKTDERTEGAENQHGQLVVAHQVPAPSSPVRTRIWKNLANIKFKALYTSECSRQADLIGRCLAFGFALISFSSVATWTIWRQHTTIWATIIAAGQVAQIGLLYVPFLKNEKEFMKMSFEYDVLYLEWERLWYDLNDGTVDEPTAKATINTLRTKENELEKWGVRCPRVKRWLNRAQLEAESVLNLDFS
jgi:hypothetical protein